MPNTHSLVCDALGSLDISQWVIEAEGVDFGTPEPLVKKSGSSRTYGESYVGESWTNRTITIPLLINAATAAALDTNIKAVLNRVYANTFTYEYTPAGGGKITFDCLKSRAHAEPDSALMKRNVFIARYSLELDAKPFGRGAQTVSVVQKAVHDWTDSSKTNYIDVPSANCSGNAPALCRLRINATAGLGQIRVGQRSIVTGNYTFDLYGANSTTGTATWCNASAAFITAGATSVQIASSLPSFITSNASAYAGTHRAILRYYTRAAASPSAANTSWYWQLKYRLSSGHGWVTLPEVSTPTNQAAENVYFVDCGTVALDQLANNKSPISGLQFVINARNTAATMTAMVDCINLIPQDEASVYIASPLISLATEYFSISSYDKEDPVVAGQSEDGWGTLPNIGTYSPTVWYGRTFYLEPSVNNRFYMTHSRDLSGDCAANPIVSAAVDITPRYLFVT